MDDARKQIDEINELLIKLFVMRLRLSGDIGRLKQVSGIDIYDPVREKQILQGIQDRSDCSTEEKEYIKELMQLILSQSKKAQEV